MAYTQPNSLSEYQERVITNTKIDGFGIETNCTIPCPFCAAPDFLNYKVLDADKMLLEPQTCKECNRGCKIIKEVKPGSIEFEFVQTSGPEQPEWLIPKMRRIDG